MGSKGEGWVAWQGAGPGAPSLPSLSATPGMHAASQHSSTGTRSTHLRQPCGARGRSGDARRVLHARALLLVAVAVVGLGGGGGAGRAGWGHQLRIGAAAAAAGAAACAAGAAARTDNTAATASSRRGGSSGGRETHPATTQRSAPPRWQGHIMASGSSGRRRRRAPSGAALSKPAAVALRMQQAGCKQARRVGGSQEVAGRRTPWMMGSMMAGMLMRMDSVATTSTQK